jgi:sugar phosphate isomerase/epimerase
MDRIEDRIGISTHFMPAAHGEDLLEAVRLVHRAGFKGLEIVPTLDQAQLGFPYNHPNVGIDLFEAAPAEVQRLKEALAVLEWVTVHAPHLDWNLASANRHLRRLTWDCYDRCLEFAAEIGAIAMTYHLGGATWGYIRDQTEIWNHSLAYAQHALERARELEMPVGFEAGALPALRYVCDRCEGWGINLDIGHAYMSAGTDEGFYAYLDQLGDRIVEVHHNGVNRYWGGYMEHQPPHMNNTIDFQGFYTRLKELGYSGPIVCEIQGHDIAQVIRHCQESKEMIVGIWGGRQLAERWNVWCDQ